MRLINCEINLILPWSINFIIVSINVVNQDRTLAITEAKLYVPVITLSTQDNEKLLQQLKSGFKSTINWKIYQSKFISRSIRSIFGSPNWSKFSGSKQTFSLCHLKIIHIEQGLINIFSDSGNKRLQYYD